MTNSIAKLMAMLVVLAGFASCTGTITTTTGGTVASWHYNCYPQYNVWGIYMYDDCYWEYYNQDGTVSKELDLTAEVADRDALILEKTASLYAEKFNLSTDSAMKIAKNLRDFEALEDRTEADLADFSERLYGVNPSEIVSAVSSAQVGNNAELEAVIEKAAANFSTSSENMKAIVKEFHGKALSENGIEL